MAMFRPHTAGLRQAMVSIYWVELFLPPWLLVIGVSKTLLTVGGFRSKALLALWEEKTDPSAVRCGGDQFSCCLIVGIHASGISVSTVPVDVVRVKSYLDNLLNSTRVPVRSSQLQLQSSVNSVCSFVQRCFWYTVHEKISCNSERVFNKTKDRQQRKFHKLLQKKQSSVLPTNTPCIDKNKWVVNLSSRPLSDTEVSLLQKGLNFAISPTSIPATEIVVKVESGINHFTQNEPTRVVILTRQD